MAPAAPPSRQPPLVALLLLCLCFASTSELAARVHGQPDALGFISIDCGIAASASYSDESTRGLRYVSDAGFVDAGAGANADIRPPYNDQDLAPRYLNVRYFPSPSTAGAAARSCYTLRGLSPGGKYLARCSFYYGNYDALSRLPSFDLHLGVNRWATVNVTAAGAIHILEAVAVAVSPADFLQVCLVNTGSGTPFISGLDLRPLKAAMYPEATVNQSLLLLNLRRPAAAFAVNRYHFWRPASDYRVFRYPFDPHDRVWQSYGDVATWTNVSTADMVGVSDTDSSSSFDEPTTILQRAAAPAKNGTRLDFSWSPDTSLSNGNTTTDYLLLLYFAEVQKLPAAGNAAPRRRFDILVDGASWNGSRGYTPRYLAAETVRRVVPAAAAQQGSGTGGQHTFSLVATPDSTLPPILNAFEIYSIRQMPELATNDGDAKAMMAIRSTYLVMKNWMGDPCAPKAFAWDGLNCSYSSSGTASITALNLSSSGLTGAVDPSIGDLKSLHRLDMSRNSLSGPIPYFLAQMPSLIFLDLSSNKLSGSIPTALLQNRQQGSLVLRIDNNPNLCGDGDSTTCATDSKERNTTLIIAIAVPIAIATLLFVAAILILHRRRRNKQDKWMENNSRLNSPREGSNLFENRQFTYKELKLITGNFREEIGRGGFGDVFLAYLENQIPVAVKIRSKLSSQGDKEFLAEARHLSRVHHRNLVSLIGYCKDKKHLALVYEYMHGGDLEERLRGEASIATPLSWHRRLKIALDATHGLEYLHKSCQPPLIHRDVKTKNILLSADLEAKISDFGLTKVFAADEFMTHVTTQPAGTLGYLDPEYYNTSRLSEKSDVYSFGVVLLELITGQPPAVPISDTESIHLAQWVRQRLSEGSVESVADPKMGREPDQEEYDVVNSVWKVAELALRCKEQPSRERPAMADVVGELRECLALLEVSRGGMGSYVSVSTTASISANDVSETSAAGLHSDCGARPGDLRQQSLLELERQDISLACDVSATSVGPAPR